jgi:uncharacterized protein
MLPMAGHAAGFDCAKAASATERAICADTSLTQMDGQMADLWAKLHAASGDPAVRQAQRQWIAQRDTCGSNIDCLKKSYRQRLDALRQLTAAGSATPRFQQTWQLNSDNTSVVSELKISGAQPLHFQLQAANGGNTGDLEGNATQDNPAHARYSQPGCQLDFFLQGDRLRVDEKETAEGGGCGAGMGVAYGGTYITAAQKAAKPAPDLHRLGIVSTAGEDAAIHRLLGQDYATLVDDVNQVATDADAGTTITTLWVRGLGGISGAILMNHDGRDFWIGLLVSAPHDQTRIRYYTNVDNDKKTLPKPIRDWRDQSGKDLPIDMMP